MINVVTQVKLTAKEILKFYSTVFEAIFLLDFFSIVAMIPG